MTLLQGNNMDLLRDLPDNSVHSVVTDPPYGLSFMGKKWDYDVPTVELWAECLRVLKPGGHLLAFAGTRTQHRMAVRIEDAGFEIRDMIAWVYGSGFPKSHDVSKAIDKAAGAEREKVLVKPRAATSGTMAGSSDSRPWIEKSRELGYHEVAGNEPATDDARQWQGWGSALKPALEPITVARKPLIGTIAENVLQHGTGAINVDGCRVGTEIIKTCAKAKGGSFTSVGNAQGFNGCPESTHAGRWPANLIHDGGLDVVKELKSAARFFYTAKAGGRDRNANLDPDNPNGHPTVKPLLLMQYLVRLVTPPGGVVLDPFMGSGTTGLACRREGFDFIGMEREAAYFQICKSRIENDTDWP
jgi:site-specific DNA-methyltransferase (adenine-specific)